MGTVSINIDLGEIEDEPEEFYSLLTFANIACGGHAGDTLSMERAVRNALKHSAHVSAHPSYPDRTHFGRKVLAIPDEELFQSLLDQCLQLHQIAGALGGHVSALKPHGALYHECARDAAVARTVLRAARESLGKVSLIAKPGSLLFAEAAAEGGWTCLREGFADRGYSPDGELIARGSPGDLLTDPGACAAQALKLARSDQFDTLCLHSDTMASLENVRAVRASLKKANLLDTQ